MGKSGNRQSGVREWEDNSFVSRIAPASCYDGQIGLGMVFWHCFEGTSLDYGIIIFHFVLYVCMVFGVCSFSSTDKLAGRTHETLYYLFRALFFPLVPFSPSFAPI